MFENLIIPQLGNNNLGGTSSSIMHLFSPRFFSTQAKRPIAYKFDGNFVPQAVDAISSKVSSMNGVRIDALTANPAFMGAMIPTTMPDYMIKMDTISLQWTFMLIVNNDKVGNGGIVRSMADNLQLYYGYFMEEPVNPVSHFGRVTVNPNAKLVITHKTIVNRSNYSMGTGSGARLDTMADIDIIPTQSMAGLSSRSTVAMRPQDLYQSVASNYNGDTVVIHDDGKLLANMGSSLDVNSKLSVPKNNIKKLLDSVADTQASLQASSFDGAIANIGVDSFSLLLDQNLKDTAGQIDQGLSTNLIIDMNHIMTRYNPHINKIDLPFHQPYAPQDQSYGSAKNAFSSMLATILPPIMADFVLAQISFGYNSHHDALQVYGVSPITAMSNEELKSRVNSFLYRLKSEIFPILVMQHGHFDLNINCDCTSVTHVNLNFFDDSIIAKEVFEVPTLLGGFNNPLIGSSDLADANAKELGGLIAILHEDNRDIPLGNYDLSSYNRSLTAHDQQTGDMGYGSFSNQTNNYQAPKDWGL